MFLIFQLHTLHSQHTIFTNIQHNTNKNLSLNSVYKLYIPKASHICIVLIAFWFLSPVNDFIKCPNSVLNC